MMASQSLTPLTVRHHDVTPESATSLRNGKTVGPGLAQPWWVGEQDPETEAQTLTALSCHPVFVPGVHSLYTLSA